MNCNVAGNRREVTTRCGRMSRTDHQQHPGEQGSGCQSRLAVLYGDSISAFLSITWAASSVVEHLTFNQGVAGSIPARPTN